MKMIDNIWKKVIGVTGGLILINGVFLPWITVEKMLDYNIVRLGTLSTVLNSYTYMVWTQYLSYALVALSFAFILTLLMDEKYKILLLALAAFSFVLSIVIFGCVHAFVLDIRALGGGVQSMFGFYFSSIDVGYGVYMCIIGSIIMLSSAVLIWYEGRVVKKET
ncbi:MAG: hypothetical protein COZ94_01740 [Nitrospirae bacterium CG_4_8_14_3_um_filter_41_47]|nr:MAG: hypothetical protein COZ94_01740 [Nitrospirae bacterium CG_4_8_14_3_um_filter_41_47]